MGTDAIMEYQYSVIARIRDILWGGKKAAPSPEYLTVIVILGIAHSKAGWKIRPPSRTMEVSKYNEKGVLEWMK